MTADTEKVRDKDRPFHVVHDNGDIVKGFNDLPSAEANAADRNKRAKDLAIKARYSARPKP